ncbi:MAG: hypothetical protein HY690_12290 [Chloroflexi bacterium]|nr:hypothetical protein [Chloroflexota bacterium]
MKTALLVAAWIGLAAAVVALKLSEAALPIGSDQGLYTYIGQAILHGRVPYRDYLDPKPPGVFYLRAAVLAPAPQDWNTQCLSGPLHASCPWLALQAADYLYTLLFAAALALVGRAAGFTRSAAFLAAALGALSISLVRLSQEGLTPEKLVVLPAALAVLCALRGVKGAPAWWLGAGSAVAAATLMKQPGATVLLPVVLLGLLAPARTVHGGLVRLGLVAVGLAAPLLLVAALLQAQGALLPLVEHSFLLNFRRLGVPSTLGGFGGETALSDAWHVFRDGLAPFWVLGGVGILVALRRPWSFLVALAAWALIDTALLARLREYVQLSPSYALLGGWVLHRLWLGAGQPPHFGLDSRLAARTLLATWLGALLVLSAGYQGSVVMRAINDRGVHDFIRSPEEWVADRVQQLPAGPLFVWGNAAQIYLHADRLPASRYLNVVGLGADSFTGEEARSTLLSDLYQTPPATIVVDPKTEDPREDLALSRFPALQRLLQTAYSPLPVPDYFYGWAIYVRRTGS